MNTYWVSTAIFTPVVVNIQLILTFVIKFSTTIWLLISGATADIGTSKGRREVSCSVFSIVGLGRTPLLLYIPYWLIVHHAAMYNEQPYNFYKVLLETYHNCQNVLNCRFNKIRHFKHILSQYYHLYRCCCPFSFDTNICY